ncbi:Alpha-amylase 2 [termite gut metagenome]|uniref:Alpha-amylase 2 n=1 Tax=termite gut metagenome TaxID=433724 RepID=A0A5J4R683_9ZZZZ
MSRKKTIIYQVFARLFGNDNHMRVHNGNITENGCGKMSDFTVKALTEIKKLGVTHIWYTGIIEHATQTDYTAYGIPLDHPAIVKGKAGSPYAIKDYYDVDPDLANDVFKRMEEFESLVSRTHRSGLKIIIDFVPNHVARQYHSDAHPAGVIDLGAEDNPDRAFSPCNNFYYIPQTELRGYFDMQAGAIQPYREYPAKATGNNHFDAHPSISDWYETVKLNYGVNYTGGGEQSFSPVPDTWEKMLNILLFWASKGVDGFRCDMAEMVPVEFWEWCIPQVKVKFPKRIFIAEIYNPSQYHDYLFRGKFDYLYDKVGLYETLRNIICGYETASAITRCWQNLGGIEKNMLNFLENHDEQRIASDFFAGDARKAISALIVAACMNTNPVMIYFGQELGESGMDQEGFSGRDGRTSIFDYWCVNSICQWRNENKFDGEKLTEGMKRLQETYRKILVLCNEEPAIVYGSFYDLMYVNQDNWTFNKHKQYAFLRKYKDELLLILANFDDLLVEVGIHIPSHAFEFLKLPQLESCTATDLLTGKEEQIILSPHKLVHTSIGAWNGKILKISYSHFLH